MSDSRSTARIHHLFDSALQREPARTFLLFPGADGSMSARTFSNIDAMVSALEAELQSDGVGLGDRVLIVAENCAEHVALILACSRVGAWSCGVNARMAPAEVAAFAKAADARVQYFTSQSRHAAEHATRAGAAPSTVSGLLRSSIRADAVAETGPLASDVAAIIFTSGTTGTPKGVMMTHEGVTHFGRVSAASRGLAADDCSYACLPMTHIFGLGTILVASLYAGASLLMRSSFDPALALEDLAQRGVTQFQGPPTMFSRVLAHLDAAGIARPAAPSLRYIYAGAGPLDMPLKKRVEAAFGLPLHHGYGLSEYAGSLHITRRSEWRDDTASGHVVEGAELQIVEPASGSLLPRGQRGEIWVRGLGLMPGYFRDPTATAAVMRPGEWYATGDLGEIGEDGALHIVGRLKEMIIRSGFNVYPAEVEAALNTFEAIERSAVVGRPDAEGNEQVIAYVQLRHGMALDRDRLRAHVSEQLAPYKRPAAVVIVPEFPFTASGKILKRTLVELYPVEPRAA